MWCKKTKGEESEKRHVQGGFSILSEASREIQEEDGSFTFNGSYTYNGDKERGRDCGVDADSRAKEK